MQQKKVVACASAVLVALAVACSKNPDSPVSPSSALPGTSNAGPAGETLKATAPTPQSPIGGAQPDLLVLTAGRSSGTFDQSLNAAYSYEFQILNAGNAVVCTATIGGGSGGSVSWTPSCTLEFDAPHSWRVRAVYQGTVGPWSATASFRSPAGGFIRGNELFDPLTNGKTVGKVSGGVSFIGTAGLRFHSHESLITYELPTNLQAGEFSLMITGIDEGSPGDKTKVMSMQEGYGDLTANDYRFTAEKRGSMYTIPGAVTFRIINGEGDDHDYINDGCRTGFTCPQPSFSDEKWYFWKFTWNNTFAEMIVREDSPRGRIIYNDSVTMNGHPYRPVPHVIHLGGTSRAGAHDASIPGAVYKNVWVSSRPRPAFPNE